MMQALEDKLGDRPELIAMLKQRLVVPDADAAHVVALPEGERISGR